MYTVDDLVSHLDSEFIEPILSLLNTLLTLDMVLSIFRSCQVKSAYGTDTHPHAVE